MSGFPGYATVESSLIICACNARVLGCALPFKTQKELALETLYSPSPHFCAQDFDTFTVGSRGMIYEPICEEQQAPTLFCIVKELMLKMFSQNDGGSERERVKSRLVQAQDVPRSFL